MIFVVVAVWLLLVVDSDRINHTYFLKFTLQYGHFVFCLFVCSMVEERIGTSIRRHLARTTEFRLQRVVLREHE